MNAAGPTGGVLLRPSDKTHPKTIVFVQCVVSRCADGRGKSYCSKNLLYVHRQTRHALPGKVPGYGRIRVRYDVGPQARILTNSTAGPWRNRRPLCQGHGRKVVPQGGKR